MQKNKSFEEILKILEEKRQKLGGKLRPFDKDLKYPSSSGEMRTIDKSTIRYLEDIVSKIKIEDFSWDDIKKIIKNIDSKLFVDFRAASGDSLGGIQIEVDGKQSAADFPTGLDLHVFKLPENFIKWFNSYKGNTIEFAAIAHVKFVTLHPFYNGNGRTAHLLMNLILFQDGYPITMIDCVDRYFGLLKKINTKKLVELSQKGCYLDVLKDDFYDEHLENFCFFVCEMVDKSLDLSLENIFV